VTTSVILCHPDDGAALWLDQMLRDLGVRGFEVVTVEQVVFSRRIVHRLSNAGESSSIRLVDGRVLRSEAVAGLVNRIRYLPTQHFGAADPDERLYATAELSAFMLAWVNSVRGRVLNPARPLSLGGMFDRTMMRHAAAIAGLPAEAWRASSDSPSESERLSPTHTTIVLDGRLFGPLVPRQLQDACCRLAVLLGIPLLQVALHQAPGGGWQFVDATAMVNFHAGGRPLAAALAQALAT
jgi:hypothetical protein